MVIVRWHGHACFEIVDRDGYTIVIDPHDGGSIGLRPPAVKADAVLITHEHFDHNAHQVVAKEGSEVHSMRKGEFRVGQHRVVGIEAFHDEFKGRRRGKVVMYLIDVDGVKILHVGDLGHVLSNELASRIGDVDILMLPVGGTFTIGPKEAVEVTEALKPRAVIPMHYWVRGVNLPLRPVDSFLSVAPYEVVRLDSNEWKVESRELRRWPSTKVVVFRAPEPR